MARGTMVSSKMTRGRVEELSLGRMAVFMRASGVKASSTAKVYSLRVMGRSEPEFGRMAGILSGLMTECVSQNLVLSLFVAKIQYFFEFY